MRQKSLPKLLHTHAPWIAVIWRDVTCKSFALTYAPAQQCISHRQAEHAWGKPPDDPKCRCPHHLTSPLCVAWQQPQQQASCPEVHNTCVIIYMHQGTQLEHQKYEAHQSKINCSELVSLPVCNNFLRDAIRHELSSWLHSDHMHDASVSAMQRGNPMSQMWVDPLLRSLVHLEQTNNSLARRHQSI